MDELFPGVYLQEDVFYTENGNPGSTVYGESVMQHEGTEYRAWNFHRSKAAAALKKGIPAFPVQRDDSVLYLGASTGTTVSHVADIVKDGVVYAVEYAPKIARQLVTVAAQRENLVPILGDARQPDQYRAQAATVDVLYQDVAQRNQVDIFKRNAATFLREDGYGMLALKAQSISSTLPPDDVFTAAKEQLSTDFEIVAGKKLAPFHTDHLFLILRKQ